MINSRWFLLKIFEHSGCRLPLDRKTRTIHLVPHSHPGTDAPMSLWEAGPLSVGGFSPSLPSLPSLRFSNFWFCWFLIFGHFYSVISVTAPTTPPQLALFIESIFPPSLIRFTAKVWLINRLIMDNHAWALLIEPITAWFWLDWAWNRSLEKSQRPVDYRRLRASWILG